MSKRFIDTEIFNDPWFMDLSVNAKLFYIYLITNCNHAGIIEINWKLADLQTSIKQLSKTYQTLFKEYKNRIIHLRDTYYFIPKYIEFQYPEFPKSKVRQQESAIKILIQFNLFDQENLTLNKEYINSYEYDNVIDSVIDSVPEKKKEDKIKYAEFVLLTKAEYKKIVENHGEYWTKKIIEKLDNHKGASGRTYKSDYRAILSWVVDSIKKSPDYARYMTKRRQEEAKKKQSGADLLNIPGAKEIGRKVDDIENPDDTPLFN